MTKKDIIGIWGYGKVGRALATFFAKQGYPIAIIDKNEQVKDILQKELPSALFFLEDAFFSFFDVASYVYASPGVDITKHYQLIKHKLKTEADWFFAEWQKPIIAVTGTVGKTTTVSFLAQLFSFYHLHVATGGNIGTPLAHLLSEQQKTCALLEFSSFQLEYAETFCPTIAVWTNFYPNHLDRHHTEEAYFLAKYKLLRRQTHHHQAIVPTSLIPFFDKYGWPSATLSFVADDNLCDNNALDSVFPLYSITDNIIGVRKNGNFIPLIEINQLPHSTVSANWLTIVATLNQMNLFDERFVEYAQKLAPLAHRTEYVTTIENIMFINDSKSTTVASALAAIEKYKTSSITLILGGLSKGVDRMPFIKNIQDKVHKIVIFGAEANILLQICQQSTIISYECKTVMHAVETAFSLTPAKGVVLFSPAGSSYDLFENYEERGDHFKKAVFALKDTRENNR